MSVCGVTLRGEIKSLVPKCCAKCGEPEVFVHSDTAERRVLWCDQCEAYEVISKGTHSWWYHGAKPAAEWPAHWLDAA